MVLIRQVLVGILLSILLTALGYGVWYGSRIESLTIIEVEVQGGETISHSVVSALVEEQLKGEYFKLVPRSFVWTYPHDEIEQAILQVARIKNVYIERVGGKKLKVVFAEYEPTALWCAHLESKECLFLDDDGYAFALSPRLEGAAFMRYSDASHEPELGKQAFTGDFIQDTNVFVENTYDQLGLNITYVEKTAPDEIVYHISGGGLIKVSTRMTTVDTLENLKTVLTSKEFNHLAPGNFNYIDLRYGDKVFVNEVIESVELASSTEIVEIE